MFNILQMKKLKLYADLPRNIYLGVEWPALVHSVGSSYCTMVQCWKSCISKINKMSIWYPLIRNYYQYYLSFPVWVLNRQTSLDLAAIKGVHKLHHKAAPTSAAGCKELGSNTTASSFLIPVCWLLPGYGLSKTKNTLKGRACGSSEMLCPLDGHDENDHPVINK